MKFCKLLCILLCLFLLVGPVTRVSAAETDGAVASGCAGMDAQRPIGGTEKLTETAKAAILYERSTGTLVYANNPDGKIYPSSMVKLMTVLVALELGDPEEEVTVTRSALDAMGIGVLTVKPALQRGEVMKLKDLLYCVMVASANDATTVVAEHIGGSQEGFVALMNEKAKALGCVGTNFTNSHGLHDENCYTTARDILRILEYGLENEQFRTMFETAEYTIPATNLYDNERVIETTNNMMTSGKYYDTRVTGGKTGSTDAAGRCLAVTALVGDMDLVGIVMGAKSIAAEDGSLDWVGSFEEMSQLLDHVQKNFERRQLYYQGQVISQYAVLNGSNNVVTQPVTDGFCVLPKGVTAEQLTWKYAQSVSDLTAPVEIGQSITGLEVWYGDVCLASTELVALNGVSVYQPYEEPKGATDMKEEKEHGELLALILGIVLGLVILVLVGMFLMRVIRVAVIRARIRKRRKNRRRNRNARLE